MRLSRFDIGEGREKKQSVLFLCTSNSCRSQMAEAFLRKYAGESFEVYSAGLWPKPIHPLTKLVMKEVGIDLGAKRSKSIKELLAGRHITYLIVVCDKAEKVCPRTMPGMKLRLFWPFKDPATVKGTALQKHDVFRDVRDQIEDRVITWISEIGALNLSSRGRKGE